MKKQREKEDYWDEYKDYNLDLNLDKSNCNKFSLDLLSSNDEIEVVIKDGRKEEYTCEGL